MIESKPKQLTVIIDSKNMNTNIDTSIDTNIHTNINKNMNTNMNTKQDNNHFRNCLRIIDLSWDVCVSGTVDGSIAVIDGATVLLTPLSTNTVPPPMSMYKYNLHTPIRHAFFWPRPLVHGQQTSVQQTPGTPGQGTLVQHTPGQQTPGQGTLGQGTPSWGLACLCDGNIVQLIMSSPKGMPTGHVDVDLGSVLSGIDCSSGSG